MFAKYLLIFFVSMVPLVELRGSIVMAVGMDLAAGYLEQKDFNHFFRIAETVALRIKNPKAIVQFELQK